MHCSCDMTVLAVDGRLDVNVALKRPSYQSSVRTHNSIYQDASHGNDGSKVTIMNLGFCSFTQTELNPWWAVDLAVALYVLGVKLTNRSNHGNTACNLYLTHILLQ